MSTYNEQPTHKDDQETRQRVLEAAAQLFAERGYNHVSIRDICAAAGANVAAVNYYFHDKWSLYKELIETIIQDTRRWQQEAHSAPPGTPAEERLRKYIHTFLSHGLASTDEKNRCWGRLMGREMTDPSPGLDLFIDQVIRPNSVRVGKLIAELMNLPPDDPRVGACVASVQTQMVGYFGPMIKRIAPQLKFTPEFIEALANHIAEFSLAGIRGVAQQPREVKK
jgi:TetR/AcrR family transcriptional regulator, regulator of cefoperazone and chloramphenicol sensitivity